MGGTRFQPVAGNERPIDFDHRARTHFRWFDCLSYVRCERVFLTRFRIREAGPTERKYGRPADRLYGPPGGVEP
jgi:hypothetical protein